MPKITERHGMSTVKLYNDEKASLLKAADTVEALRFIDEEYTDLANRLRHIAAFYEDYRQVRTSC